LVLSGHTGHVYCIAAAPDGRLVAGSADTTVRVWACGGGACEATLTGHTGDVWALCPLTDGTNRLLSGAWGGDNVARLHDLDAAHGGASVAATREYHGHTGVVRAIVELSGGRFASASNDKAVRMWAVESGACLTTLSGHTSYVWALAVADDDALVSGGGDDKTLRGWDTRTYAAVAIIETPAAVDALLRLTDGTVASGHLDGAVRLWDWRRRECMATMTGHAAARDMFGLAQLPDGRLVSASRDKTVRIWDVAARACVGVITESTQLWKCCITADGRLAVACGDNNAYLYIVDAAAKRV